MAMNMTLFSGWMKGPSKPKNSYTKLQASRVKTVKAPSASLKPFVALVLATLILVGTVLVYKKLSTEVWFPITQVSLNTGLQNSDQQSLIALVNQHVNKGFFGVNLDAIADQLEQQNWVAQATLRRVWPGTIDVLIREHQAVAQWDAETLISSNGILFNVPAEHAYKHLVLINGVAWQAKDLLVASSELEQSVAPFQLNLSSVMSPKSDEIIVTFDNQLVAVFNLNEKEQQFARFNALLEKGFMQSRNKHTLKRLDMRYSNGFSAQWLENTANVSYPTEIKKKIGLDLKPNDYRTTGIHYV